MMGKAALGALLTLGTACTTLPPAAAADEEQVPVHGETGYRCNERPAQHLVGRPATAELGAEAQRLTGARTVRWLRPGDIVTMEFREDRLNVDLDERQRVKAIRCG